MSSAQIAILGAIAGFTIFLGLPVGRISAHVPRFKAALNAIAIGILLFLLWDVLAHAWEPIDQALGRDQVGDALTRGLVLAATVGIGLLGLVWFDRSQPHQPVEHRNGPGAASVGELATPYLVAGARRLAMMIAVGIGLHNFAEGLAIGNSASAGDITLALMLVIGFGLHNATEGFGIVAPLAGTRPSWGFLAVLGIIGGGPTFLGTVVGQHFVSEIVSIAFLGLAAGSILFVVIELLAVARKADMKTITSWAIFAGLVLGFATDAILTAAGA